MNPQGATAGATAPCGEGERLIAQSISVSANASDFVIAAAALSRPEAEMREPQERQTMSSDRTLVG
jgi:hypothetical protein